MTRFLPAAFRPDHLVPACAVAIVLIVVAESGGAGLDAVTAPGAVAGTGARWAALGLLAAPAVMIYIHREAAGLAAVVCAFGWVLLGPGYGWREFLPFAYALLTVLVARRAAAVVMPVRLPPLELPHHEEAALFADAPHEVLVDVPLPATTLGSPPGLDSAADVDAAPTIDPAAGYAAAPIPGLSADLISSAGSPIAADEEPDELASGHRPPAGRFSQPPFPVSWPVIARAAGAAGVVLVAVAVALVVWWQIVAQPVWIGAALLAGGIGVALVARARGRRRELRRFFGSVQPLRRARVVDQLGYLHVLVPAADGRSAVEFGINTADDWSTDDESGDPRTVPALLYGDPAPGEWCAVVAEGRLHVPVEPVGGVTVVPYDADHGLPREISDDEEQLVDPDALRADDHLAPPDAVHEHRVSPARAWCTVAAIGLGAAFGAAEVMHLAGHAGDWLAVGVVAVASLVAVEFGWRSQVRMRLLWNLGGVTSIGFRGTVSEPWTVDTAAVHDDEGAVTLAVGDSVLTVPVPPPWPRTSSQRTRDQLVAALRDARWQAFATAHLPPPPPATVPRRPLLLVAAWAVTVTAAVALFAS
ncbi:hypothetical protein [Actinoplanes sp. NPDC049265]|uniref:hypothetical protein n=1 Tax=Actinoplanes sp. NPDC049265 TaxID=3363902 RepID=UPI0037214F17